MNIPDEAVEAAAEALYSEEYVGNMTEGKRAADAALSAALPAIERAHLEQLAAEAQFTGSNIGAALIYGSADPNEATEIEAVIRWLRARLDQTKDGGE